MEKLDVNNKIMLATHAIQFMANTIYETNQVTKRIPDENGYLKDGIKAKDDLLEDVKERLRGIMEDMGNLINGHDCICGIDVLITQPAFKILNGQDDVDIDEFE